MIIQIKSLNNKIEEVELKSRALVDMAEKFLENKKEQLIKDEEELMLQLITQSLEYKHKMIKERYLKEKNLKEINK